MKAILDGEIIWNPSQERIESTVEYQYKKWLQEKKGLLFTEYTELLKWSINELDDFWASIAEFCEVKFNKAYHNVIDSKSMPGAKWFEGATLNYTENIFSKYQGEKRALFFRSEHREDQEYTWKQLIEKVASVASSLREMGVKKGDRIAAYMPNIPETVIAFFATASIGAIWSSCSPDFGASSVIDRFKQIEPVVLFAADGYRYNGKVFDRTSVIPELQKEISSLKHTVIVPYVTEGDFEIETNDWIPWKNLLEEKAELLFESVPFDHPLWILYSSGTTGMPKAIVQGHGGIILEHLKTMTVQNDLKPDDTVFWFTTTGWVMWNLLLGGMLAGSSVVLYDGSPSYPNMDVLWELAEDTGITFFGTGAPFLTNCMKMGVKPNEKYDLSKLRSIFSTGAPLSGDVYRWVYNDVQEDIWLSSSSGGTDVCTGFVGGIATSPVRIGQIQGRALGVAAHAFDEKGNQLIDEVGELVITQPMPSMPLYFWNDQDNKRYLESYFDMYPGIWRQGDWIKFDEKGSCIIFGRSDSTINRSGVRIGSSDIYRVVEAMDDVLDSLAIDLEVLGQSNSLYLFVVLNQTNHLDDDLKNKIRDQIRRNVSPRFIPDKIFEVEQIPKTLNGKKLEVPIRKMLLGFEADKTVNSDSMSNPESLQLFKNLAVKLIETNKQKLF